MSNLNISLHIIFRNISISYAYAFITDNDYLHWQSYREYFLMYIISGEIASGDQERLQSLR